MCSGCKWKVGVGGANPLTLFFKRLKAKDLDIYILPFPLPFLSVPFSFSGPIPSPGPAPSQTFPCRLNAARKFCGRHCLSCVRHYLVHGGHCKASFPVPGLTLYVTSVFCRQCWHWVRDTDAVSRPYSDLIRHGQCELQEIERGRGVTLNNASDYRTISGGLTG